MADDQTDDQQRDDGVVDAAGDTDTADQVGGDDNGADQLGDAGKQALDRMKAERNAARKELRAFKELGLSVDDIKALQAKGKPAGDAPDPEQIREQARAEARREAQDAANARVVRAEVKAAAAGKLADPADAHRFLDLSQFEVDDDGNVDQDELDDAIGELLSKKPYLAAAQGPQRRFQGSADSGARKEKPKTLNDQIAEAEANGDHKAVMRLKSRQALAVTNTK